MTAETGRTLGLIALILLVLLIGLRLTPLAIVPLGVFSGFAHGLKTFVVNGFHVGPFMPILPFSFLMLIWIFVVIWIYRDAQRRGMNGALWALLVFFGNLIGLLIYLIVRSDRPLLIAENRPTLTCPSCRKIVAQNYIYCPHCGKSLRSVCAACGKQVEPGWKACPHCGATLHSDQQQIP